MCFASQIHSRGSAKVYISIITAASFTVTITRVMPPFTISCYNTITFNETTQLISNNATLYSIKLSLAFEELAHINSNSNQINRAALITSKLCHFLLVIARELLKLDPRSLAVIPRLFRQTCTFIGTSREFPAYAFVFSIIRPIYLPVVSCRRRRRKLWRPGTAPNLIFPVYLARRPFC
ncbi:hypothetical protein TSAR_017009 [Trichomalopsis sarcophagae]|uniref:Uncharacterized protein n=1 Tax=Trichomalopsis sarcophagae TaxID=543379 RepID=A0A232FLE5_9HYME|nr:hypothetical protein TSAR_017009 [Trichomalopsis sarcophagae]